MTSKISQAKLRINGQECERSFSDFIDWFYHRIDTPVLRGVVLEYLLIQRLIEDADKIVSKRITSLTGAPEPTAKCLKDSLSRYYKFQPHGDVFDVQLHWGVTVEIKSTSDEEKWRLHKTSDWSIWTDKNLKSKGFQAQYYIVAKLDKSPAERGCDFINFDKVEFYILSGRELDNRTAGKESIKLSDFTEGLQFCTLDDLAKVLGEIVDAEYKRIQKKFVPNWFISSPSRDKEATFIPLARQTRDGVDCAWYKLPEDQKKIDKAKEDLKKTSDPRIRKEIFESLWQRDREIVFPWQNDFDPCVRDWAVAGLVYVADS
ncbi:hypothetical protein ABIE64_001746 [Thalassospira sp. MBR-102]|uniref:hypothetical protein n=1 Tax=Thalassospira sp. MBR-102 TaxID=3156466 RepID=UPI0033984948